MHYPLGLNPLGHLVYRLALRGVRNLTTMQQVDFTIDMSV